MDEFRPRTVLIVGALLTAALLMCVLGLCVPARASVPSQGSGSGVEMRFQGFHNSHAGPKGELWSMDAASVTVQRRRFLVFGVMGLYEVMVADANLVVADGTPLFAPLADLPVLSGRGPLPRITLASVTLQAGSLRLHAERALIQPGQWVSLLNLDIHRGERSLAASQASWDEGSQSFVVPGVYRLSTPAGIRMGQGLRIGRDL